MPEFLAQAGARCFVLRDPQADPAVKLGDILEGPDGYWWFLPEPSTMLSVRQLVLAATAVSELNIGVLVRFGGGTMGPIVPQGRPH